MMPVCQCVVCKALHHLRIWTSLCRRKVAVPVPDGASWESFCRTVQQKLKLLGIDSIYLASVTTKRVYARDSDVR